MFAGLLDLYESCFDPQWLELAVKLQARQDALFWDEQGGGYFGSRADDPTILLRMKEGPLPASSTNARPGRRRG